MHTRGYVLTFHSQNIRGNSLATNDHIALSQTLAALERLGVPVVRLSSMVDELLRGSLERLPERYVCLTFDDGPDYDWFDLTHPVHGFQSSMRRILLEHNCRPGTRHPPATATAFVIASSEARSEIAAATQDNPDRMSESWWREAVGSGLLDIACHGWNHVHPAVSAMRSHPHLIEAFYNVGSADVELQFSRAFRYIHSRTDGRSVPLFAYPYGHVSKYAAEQYLPGQSDLRAAFTTRPGPIGPGLDRWRLPRFVFGSHWKSIDDLERLLRDE
jgi:peptidoglycan/xylan/chitin deacetylase (PgdA/CDA1 family)